MAHCVTYSSNVLDAFLVLNSVSSPKQTFLEKSVNVLAKKLVKISAEIEKTLPDVVFLKPSQAKKELDAIRDIVPLVEILQQQLAEIDEPEFLKFKNAAVYFCKVINRLEDDLYDISEEDICYIMSHDQLAEDWNSEQDKHWDNY
jgi:hypothetical protein